MAENIKYFKDFTLPLVLDGNGGSVRVGLDNGYEAVIGFGHAKLMPYLKEQFSLGHSFRVDELAKKLDEDNEMNLGSRERTQIDREQPYWFLENTLLELEEHNLITIKKKDEKSIYEKDIVKPGPLYHEATVEKTDIFSKSSFDNEFFMGPPQ